MKERFTNDFSYKLDRLMKRIENTKETNARHKTVRYGLIVFSVLLLVVGVILLLIDPIKRLNRKKISDDALNAIEKKIAASETDPVEMTFVVPKTGNEVEGEDYDFISETEEDDEDDGGYVVLTSIGILKISSINISYTVWDEATQVSLRYGLGHYSDSVMPGEAGNATILGHNYRDGSMFHRLGDVDVGDEVVFISNNGTEYTFHVVSSDIISADDLLDYALDTASDSRTLTLVTCTYEYGRYGWRRVVICELDEDCYPYEIEIPAVTTETTPSEIQETTAETIENTEVTEDIDNTGDTSDTENTP